MCLHDGACVPPATTKSVHLEDEMDTLRRLFVFIFFTFCLILFFCSCVVFVGINVVCCFIYMANEAQSQGDLFYVICLLM